MPHRLIRFLFRASRLLVLGGCIGAAGAASAQLLYDDVDWKESDVPPPPAFSESRLVPVEMPRYMSLKVGVDPDTIQITGDGVVRYVVVASNRAGGALNAFYDGVRCATEETKNYARYNGEKWEKVKDAEWKKIGDLNSSYTKALSSQALCRGHAPRASVSQMMQQLRNPVREVE
ncbi:MAG: CNP1-like family protein [Gammaproteobacteria bacterium]|nr:CNP1-like family protein [Gammaproteobacteria bacterium]MBU1440589.1 CNP1-like family protein [Gammaproteobacteria bacterium]MBU2285398.1 CNP1-like family protein [Gammaproteobacteria bacterium]MBU2407164.1 CNP1-like family protein [Gammaproteobacteria bacterium]